jgi:hypothetical protein
VDAERFDTLIRSLQQRRGRRGMLLGLTSGLLAALPAALGLEETAAKKKGKGKKKKKKKKGDTPQVAAPPPAPPAQPGPTCTDGVKNGSETDIDCGGPNCPKCGTGKACTRAADCASDICQSRVCQPPVSCTDGIKNGAESAIDCGGPKCSACANGKACTIRQDCQSGVCNFDAHVCKPCTSNDDCDSDFNGDCRCDSSSGNCFSNVEPTEFVNNCNECGANLLCVTFFEGLACLPACNSSEICGTRDYCKRDSAGCGGYGGLCLQPVGGRPTRCGFSASTCGCSTDQECADLHGAGTFCVEFDPELNFCTCGNDDIKTFCARPL